MRILDAAEITKAVARLCVRANTELPTDVCEAAAGEDWPLAKQTLHSMIENAALAAQREMPVCQDTGMACVFLEIGQEVHIAGDVNAAVDEGVRLGYAEGYLRKSVVADPLRRRNTGDTP